MVLAWFLAPISLCARWVPSPTDVDAAGTLAASVQVLLPGVPACRTKGADLTVSMRTRSFMPETMATVVLAVWLVPIGVIAAKVGALYGVNHELRFAGTGVSGQDRAAETSPRGEANAGGQAGDGLKGDREAGSTGLVLDLDVVAGARNDLGQGGGLPDGRRGDGAGRQRVGHGFLCGCGEQDRGGRGR